VYDHARVVGLDEELSAVLVAAINRYASVQEGDGAGCVCVIHGEFDARMERIHVVQEID